VNWINNVVRPKISGLLSTAKREVPDNLWVKCPESGQMVFYKDLEANQFVVPGSNYHMRMEAQQRLKHLFDDGQFRTVAVPAVQQDPLKFRDGRKYTDRLKDAKAATKLDEQKSTLTTGLSTVADSVRQMSANLGSSQTDSGLAEAAAKYTDTAAQKLENVAGYFENKNVREMARDLEGFARRNPAIFLGAAFGLGLLAARFLKSSPPEFGAGGEFAPPTNPDHQLPAASKGTGDRPNMATNPM